MSAQSRNRILHVGNKEIPLGAPGVRGRLSNLKGIRPICPICGELWARINLGSAEEGSEYAVARWPCVECADNSHYFTPGSIWKLLVWWDRSIPPALALALPQFSPELIRREILLRAGQILGIPYSDLCRDGEKAPRGEGLDSECPAIG